MSRQADNPKSNIDLKQPLIHVASTAPDEVDPRAMLVKVLCFKHVDPRFIARDDRTATCKSCISIATSRIQTLNYQAQRSTFPNIKKNLQDRVVRFQRQLPDIS